MNFEIELRPHIGTSLHGGGEVELDQYLIFVVGDDLLKVRGRPAEHIGYVGKKPGQPINYLPVAAAFGESTVGVFSQMIRVALAEKAKARIEQARADQAEAEKLRSEAEALVLPTGQFADDADEVQVAIELADSAVEAANQELLEASWLEEIEQQADRGANEPTEFYEIAAKITRGEKLPVAASSDNDDEAAEADSQNL